MSTEPPAFTAAKSRTPSEATVCVTVESPSIAVAYNAPSCCHTTTNASPSHTTRAPQTNASAILNRFPTGVPSCARSSATSPSCV
jgi:hypothetical protein